MKKLALILSFSFVLITGYTQNSDYKKNEISIGMINLTQSPKNQEALFENSYYLTSFNSLTYKRFINHRNAIRLTYYRPIKESNEKPPSNWNDNSEYDEQVLKIGYEYIFKQKRITPYLAIDITYLKSTSSRGVGGGLTGEFNTSENKKNGFGLTPVIGLNYKIYKTLFIGLESSWSILYLKNKKKSTQSLYIPERRRSTTKETDHSFECPLNPIVFLVKFRF